MSSKQERQTTDSKQGGEGTNSFDGKSYDALTTPLPQGNTTSKNKIGSEEGTK